MTFRVPPNFLGKPVAGSLEHVLANQPNVQSDAPTSQSQPAPSTRNDIDLTKYLILPGKKYGTVYEYPDLLVARERTHLNKNWNDAWQALKQEGAFMINLRQYADFLGMLNSGTAFDGTGAQLPNSEVYQIYHDITEVRSPWRSEWIDAKFSAKTSGVLNKVYSKVGLGTKELFITYHSLDNKGVLQEITEPLVDCLMTDKQPGIDLESWTKHAISQGLPKADIGDGALYYWHPREDRVARFGADSGRACLNCVEDPQVADDSLGVRAVRAKI